MRFIFPQGRISLTNVSERKDKMRLGMTLTSNPKDNSFVVRTSLKLIGCIVFRHEWSVAAQHLSKKTFNKIAMVKMEKQNNPTRLSFDYTIIILQLSLWKFSEEVFLMC